MTKTYQLVAKLYVGEVTITVKEESPEAAMTYATHRLAMEGRDVCVTSIKAFEVLASESWKQVGFKVVRS